jgi:3-isopropylmalate/(R)-2-methylmalate dehydratase small subunit
VLPVQVSASFLQKIFEAIEADPKAELKIDLPSQTITIIATGENESFDINDYKKDNMLNGYDDIDYLLSMKNEIETFAKDMPL